VENQTISYPFSVIRYSYCIILFVSKTTLFETNYCMELPEEFREPLIKELLNRGWFWRGDFIYAPNEMLYFRDFDYLGTLSEFHVRWRERVQRIIRLKHHHADLEQHRQVVEDNQSLVSALAELLNNHLK